jgi:hypothetical protein
VVAFAREEGYRLAVTTEPGAAQSGEHPLELRRLRVLDSTDVDGLAAMLASRDAFSGALCRTFAST